MAANCSIDDKVPVLSNIYKGTRYDYSKIEAILETCPVSIIVPNLDYAKKLEKTIKSLGYSFKRVGYKRKFF